MLRSRPADELQVLLRGFFTVGTRYVRDNGAYTWPVFRQSLNELLVMRHRGEL